MYDIKNQLDETHVFYSGSQLVSEKKKKGLISLNMLQFPFKNVPRDKDIVDEASLLSFLTSALDENVSTGFRFLLRDFPIGENDNKMDDTFSLTQNPLTGIRGASRLRTQTGRDSLDQECAFIQQVFKATCQPVEIIVPFVRTTSEAAGIIDKLAEFGLCRGQAQLNISLLCQLPANILSLDSLCAYFDQVYFDVGRLHEFYYGGDCARLGISSFNSIMRDLLQGCFHRLMGTDKKLGVLLDKDVSQWRSWLSDYPIEVLVNT